MFVTLREYVYVIGYIYTMYIMMLNNEALTLTTRV